MKLHFGHLLGLSAFAIAGCAAFFSVYGISQLFAGAFLAVVVMASALEFGKLVAASYLQRYWKKVAVGMRIYFTIGVIVLVGVTSAGIYGFLSNAYQKTSDALMVNQAKIDNITLKKERYEEELAQYTTERSQLTSTINELSKGLANNVIQYKDPETGEIITTTSSSTRRALQAQLDDAKTQRDKITPKMDTARDSITAMDLRILDLNVNNEASAELGPLIYISKLMDWPMDKVVNYFIILLVFVFDPMAIVLVLATNWVFEEERKKREEKEEKKERKKPLIDPETGEMDIFIPAPAPNIIESEEDAEVFIETLVDSPEPNDKLKEAFEKLETEEKEFKKKYDKPATFNVDAEVDDTELEERVELEDIEVEVEEVVPEPIKEEPKPITPPAPPVQTERPVAKNGIVKPASTIRRVKPEGPIKIEDIKEIKQPSSRGFARKIPRRRGNN